MSARSKLNSIEKLTFKALIDNEITHESFTTYKVIGQNERIVVLKFQG